MKKTDRRIFGKLLASYAIVFAVPLVLLFGLYLFARGQLVKGEMEKLAQDLSGKVDHVQYSLDGYYERTQAIALSIVQNEDLLSILGSSETMHRVGDARSYRLASLLRSIIISNNFIDEIVIRNSGDNSYINQDGYLADDSFLRGSFLPEERTRLLNGFTVGDSFCMKDGGLYFARSYPVSPMYERNRCMVLIRFKGRILSGILKDGGDGFRCSIIEDSSGENILSAYLESGFSTSGLAFEEEKGQLVHDGFLLAYRKSARLPITYIYSVPEKFLLIQQRRLGHWAVVVFLLFSILGCGLILYFTKKNLDPMRQLIAAVKGEKIIAFGLMDPYSEIKGMLLDAAAQKLALADLNRKQDDLDGKRDFFEALADKGSGPELLERYARDIGIRFEENEYCLIQAKSDDLRQSTERKGSPIVLCEGILRGVLAESFTVTSLCYGPNILLVMTCDALKAEGWNASVENSVAQVQRFLRDSYSIDTIVAVSNTHGAVSEMRQAYEELTETMEYLELAGNRPFARYSQVSLRKSGNEVSAVQTKKAAALIGHVKAGDFTKAKRCFNEIVQADFYDCPCSAQLLKFRLFSLVGGILNAINCVDVTDVRKLVDTINSCSLQDCENVPEFQTRLNALFDELEKIYREAENSSRDSFKDKVIAIVDANYMNADLNVSLIADMMNRNLDTVSRTFTRMTGMGLLDYIHGVRIRKAKRRMEEDPGLTIQRIFPMVGYATCESFIRAFKRIEGMTPGRYKALVSGKKRQ